MLDGFGCENAIGPPDASSIAYDRDSRNPLPQGANFVPTAQGR